MTSAMEKLAQRRSLWQQIRETTNVGRGLRESFSPKIYKKHMNALRKVDDKIRKDMERIQPKKMLQEAKKKYRSKEFIGAISILKKLTHDLQSIPNDVVPLFGMMQKQLSSFYAEQPSREDFRGLVQEFGRNKEEREQKKKERDRRRKERLRLAEVRNELIKEAGLGDFIELGKDLFRTPREREAAVLEKMYKERMKAQRLSVQKLINDTEDLLTTMTDTFNDMARARGDGNIGEYIEAARSFRNPLEDLEDDIADVYDEHFAEAMQQEYDRLRQIHSPKKEEESSVKPSEKPTAEPTEEIAVEESPDTERQQSINENISAIRSPSFQALLTPQQSTYPTEMPEDPESGRVDLSAYQDQTIEIEEPETQRVPTLPQQFAERPTMASPASVRHLVRNAKQLLHMGDKYLAGTLLVQASQLCEDIGAERQSVQLLAVAEDLINEQG